MVDPASALFDSLTEFAKLQELINNGEAERPHIECKSPGSPQLTRDQKAQLAEAVSGFANSGGGVIIYGISTTKHAHSGLDVLTQIEPIGNCRSLAQQVDRAIPTIAYPGVHAPASRILHPSKGDTRGVIAVYIPASAGDPVQSLIDRRFYFRNGDEFSEMPYEILKRMFAGAASPDLVPVFDSRLVTADINGVWNIPILLENRTSAAAENTRVLVEISNPESCDQIAAERLQDQSSVNPGRRLFISQLDIPIYRGLKQMMGNLRVSMKRGKRLKRILKMRVTVFANKMRARRWDMTVQLAKKGFSVRTVGDQFLY